MQINTQLYKRLAWAYLILAALSLLLTLHYPILSEEPVYTTTLLDMAMHHHWLQPQLWGGGAYTRPPLMNWLSLPLLFLFGMRHAIVATRLVCALSTILTAISLIWFVRQLQPRLLHVFPVLCGAVFLTGDVLFMRGWLAYADPIFTLFVFLSMAYLYLACVRQSHAYLIASCLAVFLGFLAKEPTAYVFYFSTGLCLLISGVGRAYCAQWKAWVIGLLALFIPYFTWLLLNQYLLHSVPTDILSEVLGPMHGVHEFFKLRLNLLVNYLLTYNLIFVVFIVALFCKKRDVLLKQHQLRTIVLVIALCCLPYLAPNHGGLTSRYLLPVIPWASIYVAHTVLRVRPGIIAAFFVSCFLLLAVKYFFVLDGRIFTHGHLPHITEISARPMAKNIVQISKGSLCYDSRTYDYPLQPPAVTGAIDMELAAAYGKILQEYQPGENCRYLLSQVGSPPAKFWKFVQHFETPLYLHGRPYAQVDLYRRAQ